VRQQELNGLAVFTEEDGGSTEDDFSDESYNCMTSSEAWDTHLRTSLMARRMGEDAHWHAVEATARSMLEGGVVDLELWKLGQRSAHTCGSPGQMESTGGRVERQLTSKMAEAADDSTFGQSRGKRDKAILALFFL
jgi:hypothetical protein